MEIKPDKTLSNKSYSNLKTLNENEFHCIKIVIQKKIIKVIIDLIKNIKAFISMIMLALLA